MLEELGYVSNNRDEEQIDLVMKIDPGKWDYLFQELEKAEGKYRCLLNESMVKGWQLGLVQGKI